MKKACLLRFLEFLDEHGIDIGILITNRHCGIAKWVRENMRATVQHFDHVAKCES